MKLNGAQLILQCLKEQGVEIIFGYPGGAVIPLYDALYDEKELRHIIFAHEQGATHAADGYARSTGRTGVVIATSGPGATNTVTGIATAFRDSVPMVVITGQVGRKLLGRDSFQEIDIVNITASITKKNYLVDSIESIPSIIREAFNIAKSGRPGPVLIDIPKDLQLLDIEYEKEAYFLEQAYEEKYQLDKENIEKAAKLIMESERPMIYGGGGIIISEAADEFIEFAEKICSPVTTSLMGTGAFPNEHPLFTGMVGMHGTHGSNYGITNCDLLIAIGARFSDRVASHVDSFAPKAKIIHIDVDPKEIGKNVRVDVPIVGDVKAVLKELLLIIDKKEHDNWIEQMEKWKNQYPMDFDYRGLNPKYIMNRLSEVTKGDAIITTEVGQHQMWACQYYSYRQPRSFITSGGLGTMGFGLGAAIGASFGNPHKKVINVAGDGSFKMNCNELSTLARYKCPVIQLIFNNHALGMVRQWQEMFCNERFSFTLLGEDVDFLKLGEAYGIKGIRVTNEGDLDKALDYALSLQEPIIIDCLIDETNKVLPMVAPGAPINEIIYKELDC
ncbi:biosynthetic-type acetolactate synthase large subunit [Clostridium sp. 19966]|uniref:biosynthetic-type acetolactate synthase large subunit n=1 Tax=Clostridium sp. 19966 TaxID=2768166 RepID=UPI0028DF677E|nr:biosynthetic-type acetolactate synthase large subunit [Clostridium sp. 19966]MDT8718735.1 biosynthetic-type acetolactate synthase large subunit [Clostridium sp. 19966]